MIVLITGITGFTGVHLTEYLPSQGRDKDNIDLYGIDIVGNPSGNSKAMLEKAKVLTCDILDKEETEKKKKEKR